MKFNKDVHVYKYIFLSTKIMAFKRYLLCLLLHILKVALERQENVESNKVVL